MCRKQLIEALKASKKSKCFNSSTVAEEHGKKFRLENKSKKTICRVTVDGCLINDEHTKRCDYLFKVCETEQHFLVELKGTDVSKAVEQIISTFDFVNRKLKLSPERFEGIIVSSAVPKAEQKFRALKEKYRREKGLRIEKHSHQCKKKI